VGGDERRVGQQRAHVRRRVLLPHLRPEGHEIRGERVVRPHEGLDGHRGREVGSGEEAGEVVAGQGEHAEHPVGAVDEGEAFLFGQRDRLDAGRSHGLGRGAPLSGGVAHPPLPDQGERAVGERGEVPGAAERTVLVHDRRDPGVQQRPVGLGDDGPHPGPSCRHGREPEQHHGADHFALHLRARSGGVAADEALLELDPPLGGDVLRREGPEPGGHAVDRLVGRGEVLDGAAGGRDRPEHAGCERHARVVAGDRDDVVLRKGGPTNLHDPRHRILLRPHTVRPGPQQGMLDDCGG